MERKLKDLTRQSYDLAIVGGGIYGACIAWDAALRGLHVCLVEKADFGSATSANSLKFVHGGFRHIQYGNLRAMRELIRERRTWLKIAPHLIHPLPVLVPIYGSSIWARELVSTALRLNNVISLDRNRIDDPQKHIPSGRFLSKSDCLEIVRGLPTKDLAGGAVFYDAQVYNTERLLLSFLKSAANAGAQLANYLEVIGFLKAGRRIVGIEVKDGFTGDQFPIRAEMVVNASGPWLDEVAGLVEGMTPATPKAYAKAINLVTRPLFGDYAVGISGANGYRDADAFIAKRNALLFITPWRGRSLIGTRYTPYRGTPDKFKVTEEDIEGLLQEFNSSYPAANLKMQDVTLVHGGLLPRSDSGSISGTVELSKKYDILSFRNHGFEGLISVRGVKYTTARLVAEMVVDKVFEAKEQNPPKCLTSVTPLYGGEISRFDNFLKAAIDESRYCLGDETIRRLVYNYGSAYPEVLQYLDARGANDKTTQKLALLKAEVIHGIRLEMAYKLCDVVFRRTDLGATGTPGIEALRVCADTMGAELGWSPDRTCEELEKTVQAFQIGGRDQITH